MPRLRINLLGGWEARAADASLLRLTSRKSQALLAYLAMPAGRRHQREALAALLWGEVDDGRARASLRQALLTIRGTLGSDADLLILDRDEVALDDAAVQVDAAELERSLARGSPGIADAIMLYRGPLLAGLSVQSPGFEDWLSAERGRLHELAIQALVRMLEEQEMGKSAGDAVLTAHRILALDPLHEAAHRALMRLYVGLGRRGAALQQYRTCVDTLRHELAVDPAPATQQLYADIVRDAVLAGAPETMPRSVASVAPSRGTAAWITSLTASPRVGRCEQLSALDRVLADTRCGTGGLVALVGEAGIGKSRLGAEFACRAAAQNFRILLGRCHESEQILPFSPWIDGLRSAGLEPSSAAVVALDATRRSAFAALLPELSPGSDEGERREIDHLRLFESVLHILTSLASERPMVLLLEDMHWADSMSLRLLAFLGRRLLPGRVALLLTVREEDLIAGSFLAKMLEELAQQRHLIRIDLPRLSRRETGELVAALAVAEHSSAEIGIVDAVWEASEGNPFMVHETVAAWREGTVAAAIGGTTLPRRVRDVIRGRLERLGERTQEMAALASVIGRTADQSLLIAAATCGDAEAVQALEELVQRHIMRSVADKVEFTHDAIRRVVFARLLPARLKLLHRRIAAAIEALYPSEIDGYAAMLGQHYFAAEIWDKASSYLSRAGQQAVTRTAYQEARAFFEQALAANRQRQSSRQVIEQEIDLRSDLYLALVPAGDVQAIGEHLGMARDVAVALNDRRRLARIEVYRTNHSWLRGCYAEAQEAAEGAAAIAAESGDLRLEIATSFYLGQIHHFRGQYESAAERFRGATLRLAGLAADERCGLPGMAAVIVRAWLLWGLAELGDFEDGDALAEDIVRLGERSEHAFTMADAYRTAGIFRLLRGELAAGVDCLERGLALTQARQLGLWYPSFAAALGFAYTLSGESDRAISLARSAVEQAEAHDIVAGQSLRQAWLGRAYLAIGDLEAATAAAHAGLRLARTVGEQGNEAWLEHLLGEIAARESSPDSDLAERHFRTAMRLASELGMRPLVAHCHLGLGRLYQRSGPVAKASAQITTALSQFRRMNAPFWAQQAETVG